MFIKNKYEKTYYALINKRKLNLLPNDEYGEFHHIIPKCLGGSNSPENLVKLNPREHYIAHRLLTKITEGKEHSKMWWALHRMIHGNINPLSSKQYDKFRKEWSVWIKENHPSKTTSAWAMKASETSRKGWVDNHDRKQIQKQRIIDYHNTQKKDNSDLYYSRQKKNAILGAAAVKEKAILNLPKLEYKNNIYIGWESLLKETGVSKALYNKFYKNGIDPTFRIGKDGIMNQDELNHLIQEYCYIIDVSYPITLKDYIDILDRMVIMGFITDLRAKNYIKQKININGKEASV